MLAHLRKFSGLVREALAGTDQDFTQGSVNRAIVLLAVPMMLELALESVFAIVDIFFVAKLGAEAVAVVGLTEAVITVLYAVSIGLSIAVTALIARRIGEHRPLAAAEIAAQSMWVGAIVSIAISVLGFIFAEDILRFMGASPKIIDEYAGFTHVIFAGSSSILFIFLLNGVFRGAGDAAIAMRVLWLSNAINIILDPILIFGWGPFPELGVTGAAVATTIGRSCGVILQLYYLFVATHRIRLTVPLLRPRLKHMLEIVSIAKGGIFQFFIETSSWIFLMKIVANFGANAIAAYTIAIRIVVFTFLPAWGLSNSAATLVGQNLGAKSPERAEICVTRVAKYNFIFLTIVSIIFIIFAESLIALFDNTPEVIEIGASCLRWLSYGYGLFAIGLVLTQAFNGAGDTTTPSGINLISFWLIQLPAAYFLATSLNFGPSGVFAAVFFGESMMGVLAIYMFKKGAWKLVNI
ncbi:MAG: MATE family efflux transporter [Gammaproteobacteria bacterium]